MPAAGAEVFNGLCQLFDFFLCAVLSGFVPNDEKQKVLTKPSKMSAPPPDQCKDFEVRVRGLTWMAFVNLLVIIFETAMVFESLKMVGVLCV